VIASPPGLTRERKATLAALADELVPAVDPWPSASDASVVEKWAERALAALPDHARTLARVLDEAEGRDPASEIRRLEQEDRKGLDVLVLVVVGAYYLSPKVRRVLGYPGPKRNLALDDEADHYLEGGLLDPVVARGSIYRPTP
jgi:hypothetical protein